ncbi:hypothetical protein E6W39_13465 [Kitasatospora acidiphila]|uniref:Uncharacterized protein n=1 Tax=Kitasatospora acidiphila TaxID=2567942 RepID=A0A540W289_9ACTN|nr:hypothetical protein [Kitasatospora acidiphila]TQF03077.1 hypothetical protein E6W39_13465 [Kitasatospora acidiphila]
MSWSWEYHPDAEYVAAGAPVAFLAEVARRADELVRAAEALYLDGTSFEGVGPGMEAADVSGGMFHYFIAPHLETVFIVQVTAL